MPTLHSPGVMMPGVLGPMRMAVSSHAITLQADHVLDRDAVGDGHDHPDAGVDRFHQRVDVEWRGHEDAGDIGAGFGHGLGHGVEHRQAQMRGAALAGSDAADHMGADLDGVLGVEGGVFAGEALENDPGIFVDEYAHG